jgi:hypothetical protein
MSIFLKRMNAKKKRISIQLIKNDSMSKGTIIASVYVHICADIGPAYIKAPIKTSQQYSYIRHVLRKVN